MPHTLTPERQQLALYLRSQKVSLVEIGLVMGISAERVRQLIQRGKRNEERAKKDLTQQVCQDTVIAHDKQSGVSK